MNNEGEFKNYNIDTDCTINHDLDCEIDLNNLDVNRIKFDKPTRFSQDDIDSLEKVDVEEIIDDESDISNLKDNFLPKGLTPLEDIFDSNDVARKPKMEPVRSDIEECNIGTELKPKLIKFSKNLPQEEKDKYIDLLKEYQDMFA